MSWCSHPILAQDIRILSALQGPKPRLCRHYLALHLPIESAALTQGTRTRYHPSHPSSRHLRDPGCLEQPRRFIGFIGFMESLEWQGPARTTSSASPHTAEACKSKTRSTSRPQRITQIWSLRRMCLRTKSDSSDLGQIWGNMALKLYIIHQSAKVKFN